MNSGFNHSEKVPPIYKVATKIARNFKEGKGSLKNLVYQEKHSNLKILYALVVQTCKRNKELEYLFKCTNILEKEPRLDPWLTKILVAELLWGRGQIQGASKPVQTIKSYEQQLRAHISDANFPTNQEDISCIEVQKPRYVRVNTLLTTVDEAIDNFRDEGWILVPFFEKTNYAAFLERLSNLEESEFMVDIHVPDLLIFPPKTEFYRHPAYKKKKIILQDKASCLPVQILDPTPGSVVLDMCAAPGMKTTQIAAHIQNKGKIYAVELDKKRYDVLTEMVESSGATCVQTLNQDTLLLSEETYADVEYILVDPSCTGSGITGRFEFTELATGTLLQRINKLAGFQIKVLRKALFKFKNAKRVVYSTCSSYPEENEDVVRQVLETCYRFKLVDAKKILNNAWDSVGSEEFKNLGSKCLYARPEVDKTNGFFVAVFERIENPLDNEFLNKELVQAKRMLSAVSKNKGDYFQNLDTLGDKILENFKKSDQKKNINWNQNEAQDKNGKIKLENVDEIKKESQNSEESLIIKSEESVPKKKKQRRDKIKHEQPVEPQTLEELKNPNLEESSSQNNVEIKEEISKEPSKTKRKHSDETSSKIKEEDLQEEADQPQKKKKKSKKSKEIEKNHAIQEIKLEENLEETSYNQKKNKKSKKTKDVTNNLQDIKLEDNVEKASSSEKKKKKKRLVEDVKLEETLEIVEETKTSKKKKKSKKHLEETTTVEEEKAEKNKKTEKHKFNKEQSCETPNLEENVEEETTTVEEENSKKSKKHKSSKEQSCETTNSEENVKEDKSKKSKKRKSSVTPNLEENVAETSVLEDDTISRKSKKRKLQIKIVEEIKLEESTSKKRKHSSK